MATAHYGPGGERCNENQAGGTQAARQPEQTPVASRRWLVATKPCEAETRSSQPSSSQPASPATRGCCVLLEKKDWHSARTGCRCTAEEHTSPLPSLRSVV